MKTITVELEDEDYNLSIDVESVSKLERVRFASMAPSELLDAAEAAERGEWDGPPLTPDVLDFLVTVTTEVTDFTEDDLNQLTENQIVQVGSEVINAVFEDSTSDKTRRIKRVRATKEFIEVLFGGKVTMVAGLPDDAEFENFEYDPSRNELQFIFSSQEWDKIAEGSKIPVVEAAVVDVPFDDPRDR